MNSQSKFETAIVDRIQSGAGEWVDRASRAEGSERSSLVHWLLAALALFLIWRMGRGLKSVFWVVFGTVMAVYWSGGLGFFGH